jgi:hypothetical protein
MVKVNDKEMNKEQFREWVQTARLNVEKRKAAKARAERKSLLKSHCTIGGKGG